MRALSLCVAALAMAAAADAKKKKKKKGVSAAEALSAMGLEPSSSSSTAAAAAAGAAGGDGTVDSGAQGSAASSAGGAADADTLVMIKEYAKRTLEKKERNSPRTAWTDAKREEFMQEIIQAEVAMGRFKKQNSGIDMRAHLIAKTDAINAQAKMPSTKHTPGEPFRGLPPRVGDQDSTEYIFGRKNVKEKRYRENGYVWPLRTKFSGWPPQPNGTFSEAYIQTRLQLGASSMKLQTHSHHKVHTCP
eukprot:COSAG05_NODE_1106_length_5866_cov_2.199584_1_plen_247_part_00